MRAPEKPLHIDIPVKVSDVKVAFSVGALAFEGDLPASIFHNEAYQERHGDLERNLGDHRSLPYECGHVTLHDTAYNTDRNIAPGNPYKNLISDLQKCGVKIELCRATAKAHGWGNADLLPDVKINTDAMARSTLLV